VEILNELNLLDKKDHNYIDLEKSERLENITNFSSKSNIIYSKVSHGGKDKYIGLKITNLSDLKKATPRLKLPAILSSTAIKRNPPVPAEIKEKLYKYCRTCAGLKVPLVDIFSEKGIQMRLSQQIQHLEDIDKDDSLSTQMCMDCICDLKMSYKFFMQIKKAEMKLQSICNSFNDSIFKSVQINNETEQEEKNDLKSIVSNEELTKVNIDLENKDIKNELGDYSFCTNNESVNDENESIEEFDPDNPYDSNENEANKSVESEICHTDILGDNKTTAYRYDEGLNAYVKIEPIEKEQTSNNEQRVKIECNTIKKECIVSGSLNHLKMPNILKRKLSSGNTSDDSIDNFSKINFQKFNIGLRDLKIPRLNLQDTVNIKTEENGIMYVTAKGSKPNEMLLIKVKKMGKLTEKKGDKFPNKKKFDSSAVHKIFPKYDSHSEKGSYIDEQIEQYKKRRVEVLGQTARISETSIDGRESDIRNITNDNATDIEIVDQEEQEQMDEVDEMKKDESEISQVLKEMPAIAPQYASRLEKLKQRWKDIKKRHDAINKDLAEDCTDRLRTILRQKDEYLLDFVNYLKQRKIVASRLKDEDIISLYEVKNNVILERLPMITTIDLEENIDPFELRESYQCDFCDQSFPNREMEYEHAKIHDFKLMHYCEDCKNEFPTHKAKRAHSIKCVQKFLCNYCDVILESKGKKRQHEQKHCDEMYGQLCDLCGEKFKHQGTLDQHVKSRHMQLEKIYKCPQCTKRFAFRTKLTFHLKSVHTTCRAFLCEDCGSDFKNPASLRHHRIRKHQSVNNKKECHICHKLVPVYSMSKHMHTHKAYTIECPHCDKMFKNTSTLKQHIRIHEDQRQYKCDMCGVGFNRRDGLRLHLKVHEKTDSRGLKECSCQVCGEKFPNHSMLVIHRNRTHKDGRNYTCHICNRSMISTRSLEWHLSHIHNERMPGIVKDDSSVDAETKRVSCYHCDKTFKTEMILRTHVKNTHVQKEPVKCLDCDLMFTSEVRLKHHMMIIHNRLEGTLACPHCPKRFVNQLRLKTHMISHSDERPHSCELCGFMLKTKIQLIKHKQNRHSNERPLQCKYCSWRCKQVSALVCHERTHTNERPYSCSVCKQKFKYLGDKNKHERRHESLGGSGFKRIVTGRNTNKINRKKEEDSYDQDSDQEQDDYDMDQEGDEDYEDTEESMKINREDDEHYDESQMVKFETGEIIAEESEASFERVK
jgi:hypothetical protein